MTHVNGGITGGITGLKKGANMDPQKCVKMDPKKCLVYRIVHGTPATATLTTKVSTGLENGAHTLHGTPATATLTTQMSTGLENGAQ